MFTEKTAYLEWLTYSLRSVQKPGRYIGKELNSTIKDPKNIKVKVALAFPDIYEIGMSYMGYKILYYIINQIPYALAERVFAPWTDMENLIRKDNEILRSLENYIPLNEFDIVGFTLQYEMSYTNILNMLHLGKIKVKSSERERLPIVIGGGPNAFNPEPLHKFFDLFVIGDGEDTVVELLKVFKEWKENSRDKAEFLKEATKIQGVYVPSFYKVTYYMNGKVKEIKRAVKEASFPIQRSIVKDLDSAPHPVLAPIPWIDIVHNRLAVEIFRGCTRGCRFCSAGFIYRPVRERSTKNIKDTLDSLVKNSGDSEVSLMSLSSSDYTDIEELTELILKDYEKKHISVSLPSLRMDSFSISLASEINRVRKSGITFAPEAATQRLRNVINKTITDEDIWTSIELALKEGWRTLKFYFMIGLPTEQKEDIEAIAQLVKSVGKFGRKLTGRQININLTISPFIPKPHTPFQWRPQASIEYINETQHLLLSSLKNKRNIKIGRRSATLSFMEGAISRGDRKIADVIYEAWKDGAKFDAWSDLFCTKVWEKAFEKTGVDPMFYTKERLYSDILPWDHIDSGLDKAFLIEEDLRAERGITTPDCRSGKCVGCGVCQKLHTYLKLSGKFHG